MDLQGEGEGPSVGNTWAHSFSPDVSLGAPGWGGLHIPVLLIL